MCQCMDEMALYWFETQHKAWNEKIKLIADHGDRTVK